MTYDYIIIGAGPAGLQMGYFLGQANRNYLILEAQDGPGSFYATYPRHRTLLSINKPYNHFPEPDFNMRHDWNSLLSDDESLLFKHYSEELYPSADELYRYLQDFASRHSLNIQYTTRVASISKDNESQFVLSDDAGAIYTCKRLLVATGAVGPQIPEHIEGIEHALGYENHPLDKTIYRNKRVGIVGYGNSAFEVADHLAGSASIIHIFMRRNAIKHAWQTHFVGDLRAINNTVLDMYQLKSLHATLGFDLVKIEKTPEGKLAASVVMENPHWTPPATIRAKVFYDYIIRCTGWKYVNTDLFEADYVPDVDAKGKYPILSTSWESSVSDLFYIGAAMAGGDRRSASGFIHGFRYNIRTLFHLLEERYDDVPLPAKEFSYEDEHDLRELAQFYLRRINTTSALYQLFEFQCDVMVFTPGKVKYYYELPIKLVHERADIIAHDHVLIISLEYGFHNYDQRIPTSDFIHATDPSIPSCSAFLHPVLRHYSKGELVDETHGVESLTIRYGEPLDELFEGHKERARESQETLLMNLFNRVFKITDKVFTRPEVFPPEMMKEIYFPWSEEQIQALKIEEAKQKQLEENVKCHYLV